MYRRTSTTFSISICTGATAPDSALRYATLPRRVEQSRYNFEASDPLFSPIKSVEAEAKRLMEAELAGGVRSVLSAATR